MRDVCPGCVRVSSGACRGQLGHAFCIHLWSSYSHMCTASYLLQDFYDYGDEEGDEQMAQGEQAGAKHAAWGCLAAGCIKAARVA